MILAKPQGIVFMHFQSPSEQITMFVHRAPLNRHAIPSGGNCALEPGAAIDDEELGTPQAARDKVVEHGAPGRGALAAHLLDRQQKGTRLGIAPVQWKPFYRLAPRAR
jgi:hypothetical protein